MDKSARTRSGFTRRLGACLMLAGLTLAIYRQALDHDFINFDDNVFVTENPRVQEGFTRQSISWSFSTLYAGGWHPLTWLSHILDVSLFGLDPGGHHLTNLVFHTLSVVMLFMLLNRMTGSVWRSAAVAALFAVHPLNVEPVAWVAARKMVLCGFFWMVTMLLHVEYSARRTPARYALTVAAFMLGLLSHAVVITLPVILLLIDRWPLRRIGAGGLTWPDAVKEKLPLMALCAGSAAVTIAAAAQHAMPSLSSVTITERVSNSLVSYLLYVYNMIWPSDLAVFYPYPARAAVWPALGAAAVLIAVSAAAFSARRRHPWLFVGWFWYLIALFPLCGLLQQGAQSMADRYAYLTLIGLFIAVVWEAAEWAVRGRSVRRLMLGAVSAGVILALVARSAGQVVHWRDDFSLFEHALEVTDRNWLMHNNLGTALLKRQGDTAAALAHYKQALAIHPDYPDAYNNLGFVMSLSRRHSRAADYYQQALDIDPEHVRARFNLGSFYLSQDRPKKAAEQFTKLVALAPEHAPARVKLGQAREKQGRFGRALLRYEQALALDPGNIHAHYRAGALRLRAREVDSAVLHLQAALESDPEHVGALKNLGFARALQGDTAGAMAAYRGLLRINPDDAYAHNNLGTLLAHEGRPDKAARHFSAAVRIKPDFAEAAGNLRHVQSEKKRRR